jgi:hypothetical protein
MSESIEEVKKREICNQRESYKKIVELLSSRQELTREEKLEQSRAILYIKKWTDEAIEEAVKKFTGPRKKVVNRPAYVHIESTPVVQEVPSLPHGIMSALKRPNAGKQRKTLTFGVLKVCEFEKDSSTDDFGVIVTIEI